jgi:rRNA small subunit pseudouridine methyltransferase Nep1
MTLQHKTLSGLLREIKPTRVIAFSRTGSPRTLEKVISRLVGEKRPVFVVGGYPHGHFSKATMKSVNEVTSIDPEMLDAWTVTTRAIHEYERALSLSKKRLEREMD